MTKAWQKTMTEYYGEEGEVFDTYDDTSHLWTYVSHFHNVPFYVYSYAFADLVVRTDGLLISRTDDTTHQYFFLFHTPRRVYQSRRPGRSAPDDARLLHTARKKNT